MFLCHWNCARESQTPPAIQFSLACTSTPPIATHSQPVSKFIRSPRAVHLPLMRTDLLLPQAILKIVLNPTLLWYSFPVACIIGYWSTLSHSLLGLNAPASMPCA